MDLLLVNSYPFVWMIARQNKNQSGERPLRYQHICRQGDGCPVAVEPCPWWSIEFGLDLIFILASQSPFEAHVLDWAIPGVFGGQTARFGPATPYATLRYGLPADSPRPDYAY